MGVYIICMYLFSKYNFIHNNAKVGGIKNSKFLLSCIAADHIHR